MNNSHGVERLPLCILGPGGEFCSAWMPAKGLNDSKKARISKEKEDHDIAARFGCFIRMLVYAFSIELLAYWCGAVSFVRWMVNAIMRFDSARKIINDRNIPNTRPRRVQEADWPVIALGPEGMEQYKEAHYVRSNICSVDPETTEDSYAHSKLPAQTWLFPDYAGVGRRAARNQSNRIRTHRRPGKERTVEAIEAQGTFFGAYPAGGVPG